MLDASSMSVEVILTESKWFKKEKISSYSLFAAFKTALTWTHKILLKLPDIFSNNFSIKK